MGAPLGNEFWKLRKDLSETGKKLTPEQILTKAQEYITRCATDPLKQQDFRGKDIVEVSLNKMRAMSLEGLYFYLDISKDTWQNWKKDSKYLAIITRVENLMFTYNFEGASANLLNQNIIAKKLGLVDKKELEHKGLNLGKAYEEQYTD